MSWLDRVQRAVAERFLIPVLCSRRRTLWIAARQALGLPFQLVSPVYHCVATVSEERLRIVYHGNARRARRLLTDLFDRLGTFERTEWVRGVTPKIQRRMTGDLIAAEIHPWQADCFRRAGWLVVPHTVRWEGALEVVPPSTRSDSLASDFRKLTRHAYASEVAGSTADWREFYERMVIPTLLARHGAEAWILGRSVRRKLARRGTLLLVRRDGDRVAGICGLKAGTTFAVVLVGVRDGDAALMRDGALVAADVAALAWARKNRLTRLDWGPSSPFVKNGLHRFKRKWGFTPHADELATLTALYLNPSCDTARNVFARQPVLVDVGARLEVYRG